MKRVRDASQHSEAVVPDGPSCQPAAKRPVQVDSASAEKAAMHCSLPPHSATIDFASPDDYESHYLNTHTNRCLECHKNFPSAHLLELHVQECHDPLVLIQRERGQRTYSCFVSECQRKFQTPQKRRMHLIDKHMYPKNFFFAVTKEGVDKRHSLLVDNRRRQRPPAQSSQEKAAGLQATGSHGVIDHPSDKSEATGSMSSLTGAMHSLQLVPSSVRFGRGRPGFSKSKP
ncbi:hypothetical protein CDD82_5138 [Ophiocordyceps australis]|uniref:C2H2-type domain-containing protein n=1 Tax=Ophiocordyceps australis TaxID=1399860 RepID=A0A2C5YX66_9HYPO|nr:hypothetical protein CDD82_5138 [Ophiocordyceps australis]